MNKKFNESFIKGILVGFVMLGFAAAATGAGIKLNPIKPSAKQIAPLTDEQQGILAVRNAKASVVNIVGDNAVPQSGTGISAINVVKGTGFIIDSEGLIVSNNHVVRDDKLKYTVLFADGSQHEAKILGLDKYNDIAILKIDAKGLPVATLGNSDSLETGQTVFAIGNSLGKYQNTVTKGVVSGLGRSVDIGDPENITPRLLHLIQTDAAINPGNSGGPLINLAGEVIGMNTLIDTGGSNLGFAVPMNVIKDSVSQLKTFGKVSKPYVGLQFYTIDKTAQQLQKLPVSQGAFVNFVGENTPAMRAGIVSGDIVTAINGELLTEGNQFDTVINRYQAGTQVLITFLHNGSSIDAPLVLETFK